MSRTVKDTSMAYRKKSISIKDFSIVDAENFEPPQLSSTPSKIIKTNSKKRILKDNNSLNISVINKEDQNKKIRKEIDKPQYKPKIPVIEENLKENVKCNRLPELFYSDPEESFDIDENINDSDDKWTTLTNVSEDKNCTNISDLLAEIDADIEVKFDKPPRRSYPGRKRNNKSLFDNEIEDIEEKEEKLIKKYKKPKKQKINPQEEAFIRSINEHFNDIETFNLAVE